MSAQVIGENVYPAGLPWYMHSSASESALSAAPDAETRVLAEDFLKKGYAVIPGSVTGRACDAAVEAFRRCEKKNTGMFLPHRDQDGHYPRIVNLHLIIPELRSLFSANEKALRLQDFLFGAETVICTSLFYERGSAQSIHRDTPVFCTRPEYRYFGMWVALEDVDEGNGPLIVMEGGHRIAELDREAIAAEVVGSAEIPRLSKDLWNVYQERVAAAGLAQGLSAVPLAVSKGTTILWHPQLPHGGLPIQDLSRTRYSLVMHTVPLGTPVYHQDVFFSPRKSYPTTAKWAYLPAHGRRYVDFDTVDFGHKKTHNVDEFWPGLRIRRSIRLLKKVQGKMGLK